MCSLLTVPVFARLSHRHKLAQRKATPRRAVCLAGSPLPTPSPAFRIRRLSHQCPCPGPWGAPCQRSDLERALIWPCSPSCRWAFSPSFHCQRPWKGPPSIFLTLAPISLIHCSPTSTPPPRWNCPSKVPHPHWVLLTSLFSLEQPLGPQPHTAGLTYPCASSGLTTNEQLGREGRKPVHQALWTKGRGTNLPLKTPFSHCWSQGGCSLIIQEFFGSWQLCCSWVLRGGPWFCCRVL